VNRIRRGVVVAFEDQRGLGVVEESAPVPARYRFHVTAIAGGKRTIEVGAAVAFLVVAGQLGEYEAAEITPVQAGP
jgi:cold shock CspA family protein